MHGVVQSVDKGIERSVYLSDSGEDAEKVTRRVGESQGRSRYPTTRRPPLLPSDRPSASNRFG